MRVVCVVASLPVHALLITVGFLSFGLSCAGQQNKAVDSFSEHLREAKANAAAGRLSSAIAQVQAAIALEPDDASGWYELGSLLGQMGNFLGAGAALQHAIQLQPNLAKAHYELALTLIGNPREKQDWAGAVDQCREALKLQADYPEALNLLGAGLTTEGQFAPAIAALQQSLKLSPRFAEAHFNLGLAMQANGQLEAAEREYRAAIAAREAYPAVRNALAKLLLELGQTAAAEREVQTALRQNPDLTEAHYTRARILQALHRNQQAATEFAIFNELSSLLPNGIQASQLSNKALAMASKGDLAGAQSTLIDAIALKPDYGVSHFNLGLILADRSETSAAVQELSEAISLLPGQAAPWFELGRVLSLSGDDGGALQAVSWAAHLEPANAAIQAELSRLQSASAVVSAVQETFVQPAFGATSDTVAAHIEFATQLTNRGDFEGAAGELLRALVLDPASRRARSGLAAAYQRAEQHDRAMLEYQKLLIAFPDDVVARIALAKILLAKGKDQDAADELRQALVYQPDSQEALAVLKKADQLAHPR